MEQTSMRMRETTRRPELTPRGEPASRIKDGASGHGGDRFATSIGTGSDSRSKKHKSSSACSGQRGRLWGLSLFSVQQPAPRYWVLLRLLWGRQRQSSISSTPSVAIEECTSKVIYPARAGCGTIERVGLAW